MKKLIKILGNFATARSAPFDAALLAVRIARWQAERE